MNEKSYCIVIVTDCGTHELNIKKCATAYKLFIDCCKCDECIHCEFYEIGQSNSYCNLIAMSDNNTVQFF